MMLRKPSYLRGSGKRVMIDELRDLKKLLDEGLISSDEYERLKNNVLYKDESIIEKSKSNNSQDFANDKSFESENSIMTKEDSQIPSANLDSNQDKMEMPVMQVLTSDSSENVANSQKGGWKSLIFILILALVGGGIIYYLLDNREDVPSSGTINNVAEETKNNPNISPEFAEMLSDVKDQEILNTIAEWLKRDPLEAGSKEFYASKPIFVIKENSAPSYFYVTMAFPGTINLSSDGSSSEVYFQDYWEGDSIRVYVRPKKKGMEIVLFTNDANDDMFEVLVVVTE